MKTPTTATADDANDAPQSAGEEIANSVTHGLGALLSIAGLVVLVVLAATRADAKTVATTAVFGATLILLYTSSTLYHSISSASAKRILRKFDHAAIYLLIAGTYTPLTLGPLQIETPAIGWTIFGIIWGLALLGVILKIWFTGRFDKLSTALYVGMGWLIVVALKPLFAQMDLTGIVLLVGGGVTYTAGVIFYLFDRIRYFHAIWHLFVLGGSVLQYFAVLVTVIPAAQIS